MAGSEVMGPMRAGNFPAFSRIEDAQDFAKKRGGTVIKADKIRAQSLQTLHRSRQHLHQTK